MRMPRKMSRYFLAAGIIPPQEGNRASGEDPEEMVKREETSAAGGRLRLLPLLSTIPLDLPHASLLPTPLLTLWLASGVLW